MSSIEAPTEAVRNVYSTSFISFATADHELFDKTVEFYKGFGFLVVQEYDPAHPQPGVTTVTTHSQDSIREVWLTAYPPKDPKPDQAKPFGATVKLRLCRNGDDGATCKERREALAKAVESKDYRSASGSCVMYVTDIGKVIAQLKDQGLPFQQRPTDDMPVEVYTVDPLGHVLGFTTRASPFSHADSRSTAAGTSTEVKSLPMAPAPGEQAPPGKKQKVIAVMTSGGDAPGMNAAVRAVVRTAIYRGCKAYAIREGYEGLVKGGDLIQEMSWDDVRGFLSIGGTSIGTARCAEFRERSGRLVAAKNMIKRGINGLVVCGGDGSLTGADKFREEWPSLLKELVDTNELTKEEVAGNEHLYICGMVGSIDNDMSLTDVTIGAFSSLDRICQSVDFIEATAQSHSRAFVVEVMGRHCGWLALMAGIATGADYILIPEKPPKASEWSATMKEVVARHRQKGMRKTIVIVAEGAIDSENRPITSNMVKDVLGKEMGLDTRVTTLGHVQRGGTAVAYDRLLATLQGVEAVDAILSATPSTPSPMIGITENKIVHQSLVEAVAQTKQVAEAIGNKDFERAMSLRDSEFSENLQNFLSITSADSDVARQPADKSLNVAIICVGAPAGGMNAAIRAAACYCFSRGHKPYAIHNGWSGLARHESVRPLSWLEVEEWASKGGCEIGTNRALPETDYGMIAYYFQKYAFDGLIIIGGFEAYHSLHQLDQVKTAYPAFRIPMACLPATISNNVPGTEYSLGTDTCLNSLVNYCDVVKQSASSTRRRAFVVEVQGGNSGFIAAYCGLVTGAYAVYTPEEGIRFNQLGADIDYLKKCFSEDQGRNRAGRLVVRNEKASKTFTTETLVNIIQDEAGGAFEAREAVPGHVQQGGIPSPMDRCRAARLAIQCVRFLENKQHLRERPVDEQEGMASVVGIRSSKLVFTPVKTLWDFETESTSRRPNKIFWGNLVRISELLVGRPRVSELCF